MTITVEIPHIMVVNYPSLLSAMKDCGIPIKGETYLVLHPDYSYKIESVFNKYIISYEKQTSETLTNKVNPPTKGD